MDFRVNTNSRTPIYQQLVQQVRERIARGQLAAETRLPSVRELSRELVVNPNTVARAYTELEREGLLVSRQGLGVFVARQQQELTKGARERRLRELLDQWLTEAVHLGFTAEDVIQRAQDRVRHFQWASTAAR